jgi:ParB-like chromosome segregation protein Spo0J
VVLAAGQLNIPKESDAVATNDDRKFETWELGRFQENPLQRQVFAEPPQHEVGELAADMQANGQTTPVEALPDGALIAGHKRLAAARLLGWKELDVWVRADLADDPAAAERRLIEDNLHRRQLGPLGLARCYRRLKELESKGPGGRLLDYEARDLRDRLSKRLGDISGRTLDRYLRIVKHTTAEVQAAADAGTLPLSMAERVADLTTQKKEQIAEELRAGGKPREVVRRHLAAAPRRAKKPGDATKLLVQALKRALADLRGRVGEVRCIAARDEEALRGGERLIRRLLKQARAVRAADAVVDDLLVMEDLDPEPEADEANGGSADLSSPDNVSRARRGEERKYSASPDRRTARKQGQSGTAGAKRRRTGDHK